MIIHIILISIFCYCIIFRNIIKLIYIIKNRNVSREDKIYKIIPLVSRGCIFFLVAGMPLSIFIFFLPFPLSIPIIILTWIIVYLPYRFRLNICDFLIRKFIFNIKKTNIPSWIWIPNVRLNDLYFGTPYIEFDSIIPKQYSFCYLLNTDDKKERYVLYRSVLERIFLIFTEKTSIFIEAGISSNLYYQGHNLIGLTLKELKEVLNVDDLQITEDNHYYESKKLHAKFKIDKKVKFISISNN